MAATTTKNLKRRPLIPDEHPAHHDEGWIFSYADMITILMTFFILMLSISNVSTEKYEQLKKSVSKSTQSNSQHASAADKKEPQNLVLDELKKKSVKGAPTLAGIPLDAVARKAAETGGDRMAQLTEGVRILMSAADKNFIDQDVKQVADFEKLKLEMNKMLKATQNKKEFEKNRPFIVMRFTYDDLFTTEKSMSVQGKDLAKQLSEKINAMEIRPWVKIELEPAPVEISGSKILQQGILNQNTNTSLRYGSLLMSEFTSAGNDPALMSVGVRPAALPSRVELVQAIPGKKVQKKSEGTVKITLERRPIEYEQSNQNNSPLLESEEGLK